MSPAAPNSLATDTARFSAEKRGVALGSMAAAMTLLKTAAGLRSGANHLADFNRAQPRLLNFEHTGELIRALPQADAVIHGIPREPRAESISDRVRTVSARNSVPELSVQSHQGRLRVEQHVELDENMSLLAAHGFLSGLEAEILSEATGIDSVLPHIDGEPAPIEQPEVIVEADRKIEHRLRATESLFEEMVDVHEILVGRIVDHISLSCHRTRPDQLPRHRMHAVIAAFEGRPKPECPEVYRVTIHPQPMTDNLH